MRTCAIGPFTGEGGDDWPAYGSESLRMQGWEVIPFTKNDLILEADVCIVWSPEYHGAIHANVRAAYRVACLGDWHIRLPSADELSVFDLIATDWRGLQKCRELGIPDNRLLWFRMFSYDPRLHWSTNGEQRDIDVAFMGRPTPYREALQERLLDWHERTGRRVAFALTPYTRGAESEVYRQAKIVLGDSQRGELQMRAYEAMACGALYVVQHDAVEAFQSDAPIPTYDPAHVESFLEAWLADDAAREKLVAHQREWVRHERPADHLAYLLNRIGARLDESGNRVDRVAGRSAGHRLGDGGLGDAGVGAGHHPVGGDSPRLRESEGVADADRADRQGNDVVPVQPADLAGVPSVAAESVGVSERDDEGIRARPTQRVDSADRAFPGGTGPDPAVDVDAAPTRDEQRPEVVALVPVSAQRVLDLGCGRGGVGWRLTQDRIDKADLGLFTVYGVDASPKALAVARERLHGDFEFDLNYPGEAWQEQSWYQPGTYDCVILADILEHLVDPWHALELVKPLLAPDGVVVASIPNLRNAANVYALAVQGDFNYHLHGRDPWRGPADNVLSWAHLRFFTRKTAYEMFVKAGYEIVHAGKLVTNLPERVEQWLPRFEEILHEEDLRDWQFERDAIQFIIKARPV